MDNFYSLKQILNKGRTLYDVLWRLIEHGSGDGNAFLYLTSSNNPRAIVEDGYYSMPNGLLRLIEMRVKGVEENQFSFDIHVLHSLKVKEEGRDSFFTPMADIDKKFRSHFDWRQYELIFLKIPKFFALNRIEEKVRLNGFIPTECAITRQLVTPDDIYIPKAIGDLILSTGRPEPDKVEELLKRFEGLGVNVDRLNNFASAIDPKDGNFQIEIKIIFEAYEWFFVKGNLKQDLGIEHQVSDFLYTNYQIMQPVPQCRKGHSALTLRVARAINSKQGKPASSKKPAIKKSKKQLLTQ